MKRSWRSKMITVYGIKNCDTCRKALKWLDSKDIAHTFIDVRKDGINEDDVKRWLDSVGVDILLNRHGTTWRGLSDGEKANAESSDAEAISLMAAQPATRPLPAAALAAPQDPPARRPLRRPCSSCSPLGSDVSG